MGHLVFNLDKFIAKCEAIFGVGTYDYSKIQYRDSQTALEIVCPKEGHGSFWKTAGNLLQRRRGCPVCLTGKKSWAIPPSQVDVGAQTDDRLTAVIERYTKEVGADIASKTTIQYFKSSAVGIVIATIDKDPHHKWVLFFVCEEVSHVLDFVLRGKLDGSVWTSTSPLVHSHFSHRAFDRLNQYVKTLPEYREDEINPNQNLW
jgi:hypothetical protein